MIWYKEHSVPDTKNFLVKRELLDDFKKFCKDEFINGPKDIFSDFEKKVEHNIFLNDFEQKDKEYLKMILGLLKYNEKSFNYNNVDELLSTERLSHPSSVVISHNEINFFILKKACSYLSLVKPDSQDFTWLKVLEDIKTVTTDPFFISEEFMKEVRSTRNKILKIVQVFEEIEKEDECLEMNILVKPLMSTNLVLKIPQLGRELFQSFIQQGVIHPAMKMPNSEKLMTNSNIFLEHLIENPQKDTSWFIQKAILEGDAWIDYDLMYAYYCDFYSRMLEPSNSDLLKPYKEIFQNNLEIIRVKNVNNIMSKENSLHQLPSEDCEIDSESNWKL